MNASDPYSRLCKFFEDRHLHLSLQEIAYIRQRTTRRQIPRHSLIMQQGQPVPRLYFLNQGIVRLTREHNGELYTLGIVSSGEFVSTTVYLLNQKESSCALEALTDLDVFEWDRETVLDIKANVSKSSDLELALLDRLLTWVQDHQIDALCLTAEERYQKLVEREPQLLHTLPLKYIASYLSIHKDSLSRIRKAALAKG